MNKPNFPYRQSTAFRRSWKRILRITHLMLGLPLLFLSLGVGAAFAEFDADRSSGPLPGINVNSGGSSSQNLLAVPVDNAAFVRQNVPTRMNAGQTASVSITMRNSGTTTWSRAAGYKLGSENPRDNTLWTGGTRIYLSGSDSISPGQTKTFTFDITAPSSPGTYNFQWRMVHEGVQWFGASTINVRILVEAPTDSAQFVSQNVPTSLQPGQRVSVSIKMRNSGSTSWTRAGGYKLGSENPRDNTLWTGGTRVLLSTSDSIAPGQTKTFSFNITAPTIPGTYNFQWRMVHEGVHWFGSKTTNVIIRVEAPSDGAQFVSQNVPTSLQPGQRVSVSIKMRNSGSTTWTRAAGYKLGSENPRDNTLWTGGTRVFLSTSDSIAPGQSKTFSFNITAPTTPGTYNFQWRMVHEGVHWFGSKTTNVIIRVEAPSDGAAFVSQSVPTSLQPGQRASVSIKMRNSGSTTWTRAAGYKLGSENPRDNTLWTGGTRINMSASASIAPGQSTTFAFEITAPTTPGTYNFQWRMVHEGVHWFGSKTTNVIIRVEAPTDGAQFVSQTVPTSLQPGQRASVSITMRNSGSTTWTRAAGYKLGSENPRDNTLWTGGTRINMATSVTVAPGQSTTFAFEITAPTTPGTYNFQWRMVHEGVHWFGSKTTNVIIRVEAPSDGAAFVSQSVPTSLQPGQRASVSITMRNSGSTTWTRAGGYKLGSENPRDNTLWTGGTRINMPASLSILPGQSLTFTFEITAPTTLGTYNFQWRMVHEGVHWFGSKTTNVRIRVEAPSDGAQFVSQTVPASMDPGQTASVSITMRNSGSTTWTRAAGYKLGTQNPQDNKIWIGVTRVYLEPGDSIAPGQSKTFTFDITAPTTPDIYNFQWRMVHESVQWFGDYTQNVPIAVGSVPAPTPTPTPIGNPFPIRPGLWPASGEETSTSDLDGDGLLQRFELQLAQTFFPTIWYDDGEDCTYPGGALGYPPNRPGRLIFRVRPHPDNPSYISMTFALLYRKDCGDFMGISGHPGDVEPFSITLAPNPACDLGYGAYALTTWAHYGTKVSTTRTRHLGNRCRFGFSRNPTGKHDVVMASENKHGNYISDSSCDGGMGGADNCDFDFTLGHINSWVGFNVGEEWVGQQRHHNLGPLGFPGERLWEGKRFCGSTPRRGGCPGPAEEKMFLIALRDVPKPYGANFISQIGVPTLMQPGQKAVVSITMENTGTLPWTRIDGFHLGSQNPRDNTLWTGGGRIFLAPSDAIQQGHRKTFSFEITAPSTPGIYNFQWRMVHEGVRWFGKFTPNVVIVVSDSVTPTPSANDSEFVSQSVPSQLEMGQTATVSITLRNSGSKTWTRETGYKLGTQNPQDNTLWTGNTRVRLAPADTIQPGQTKTFTFSITAPDVSGHHDFQWRMLKESEAWFGDLTPNVSIDVTSTGPTPTPPPVDPQPSFPIRAAHYYPWFPEAWDQRGIYPFTQYTPTLGMYDSADRKVIRSHIEAMEYANIEVGISSWWGQGHYTDQRLKPILDVTRGRLFRWTVHHEAEGYGNPSVQVIREDLTYLAKNYGSDPSYLRVNGRFVVFVYGGSPGNPAGDETCDMPRRWNEANTVNAYIVLKVFPGYRKCSQQPDGWHQYAPAQRTDSQGVYSYMISPGFWLASEGEPRLSRDLTAWNKNIRTMIASGARFQIIVSMNEWGEGTSVESALEWQSKSGYGDYLDALAKNGIGGQSIKTTPIGKPEATPTPSPPISTSGWDQAFRAWFEDLLGF